MRVFQFLSGLLLHCKWAAVGAGGRHKALRAVPQWSSYRRPAEARCCTVSAAKAFWGPLSCKTTRSPPATRSHLSSRSWQWQPKVSSSQFLIFTVPTPPHPPRYHTTSSSSIKTSEAFPFLPKTLHRVPGILACFS